MALEGLSTGDTAWVLTSAAFVLLMTPGLAFFYGGLVKGSNVLNTMMMCIISMGIVTTTWALVGFSLAFGSGGGRWVGDFNYAGLVGLESQLWDGTGLPALLFMVFQMTFAIIGAAIISGAVAERMKFSAYAVFIAIWSVLVYAPVCHWVWGPGGWIEELGAKDFAGGTVVHESTAVSALVLAVLVGPRASHAGSSEDPHNVPFVILGAALLWFGWSGFNGGSALAADETAALALVNTYLCAATGLFTWAVIERLHKKRYSATGTVTGAIVGLVVITPAAGFVTPTGALAMGVLGIALVYPAFRPSAKLVDDSLDCFPCHGVGGFVGTCLTGLFATDGGLLYGGGLRLLGVQVAAGLAVAAFAAMASALIYLPLSLVMRMRVDEEHEITGLDTITHGESAYDIGKKTKLNNVSEEEGESSTADSEP